MKEDLMAGIKKLTDASEESCRQTMIELLELKDTEAYRKKMIGYEKQQTNNVNLVNKIIKSKKKQLDVSSNGRRLNSPRSLQAGPFGQRA